MKVGTIVTPNQKGQIVIPQAMRKALGIEASMPLNLTLRGNGLYLYPIEEILVKGEKESSYLEILKKTQGAWAKDDWSRQRSKKSKIELAASQKRKQPW